MLSKKNFPLFAGILSLAVLLALFSWMARQGSGGGFSIQSFAPQGAIRAVEPIRITFTQDVVSSGDVGRALVPGEFPISITPELSGTGKWADRATFVFSPAGIMEATSYAAEIKSTLRDVHGSVITGAREYAFFTAPLEFLSFRQTNFDTDAAYIDYEFSFSLPVSTAKLEAFLSAEDSSGQSVPLVLGNRDNLKVARVRVPAGDASPIIFHIEKGLTPERGTLGLAEAVSVKAERDLGLKVLDSAARTSYNYYGDSSIYLNLTSNLDMSKAGEFIEITPKRDVKYESYDSTLRIIGDFKNREKVTVRLKKGLPPMRGAVLAEDWTRSFIFPDAEPSVFFQHSGRFLSSAAEALMLPISTVNTEKLDITVKRVYDNNVSYVMLDGWSYYLGNLAEDVSSASYVVDSTPNETVRSAIDLKSVIGDAKGIFAITATGPDYWPWARDTVNVTDMAGTLKFSGTSLIAWVNSISDGKPISGANVKVYSKSNQILGEGVTGPSGVWTHSSDHEWQGALMRPHLAVFSKGKDTSVLLLDDGISQMYSGDYSGVDYPSGAYQVMCYTPRGVFRPGESVPVFLLFRENNRSIKTPFPVQVKVRTPDGRLWMEKTEMLSSVGMASSEFLLSDAAQTGAWRAEAYIPGEEKCIADASFLVEDFAPPRINVEVSSDKSAFAPNEDARLFISSQYLFGSPADGLNYEVNESFIPREYSNPNWPGYVFSDNRITFSAESSALARGTLSESGDAAVAFKAPVLSPPSMLDVIFEVAVMQDDGRWVYKTLSTPYYPRSTLFGIRRPDGDISARTQTPFAFAALSQSGEAISTEAALSVFKVETRLITTMEGGNRHTERVSEYIPVEGLEEIGLRFNDGKATADLTFPSYGYYRVTLEGSDSAASLSFWVMDERWRYDASATLLPETLEIMLDKKTYNPGEKARARVLGNFDGTVLLTVETRKTLYHDVVVTKGKEAEFTWDVTEEMAPNSWVTAHLVRPAVSREESWSAHRAFSAVPLNVSMAKYALSVDITAPLKLKPRAENDFAIQLTDSAGRAVKGEVALMLVDDGVLGLTRFQTPNPFLYFTKRRGLGMFVYDVYDQLIPLVWDNLRLLKPGGGDLAEDGIARANLSPVRAKRFEVLTVCKRLTTDNNGNVKFSFVLPEFSGRARLMAVAAAESAYGAQEAFFNVSDSVVVEHSLPRVVALGDSFESQLMLFNKTGAPLDVDLDVKISGPLSIAGTQTAADAVSAMRKSFSLPETDRVFAVPLLLEAADEFGVSEISVSARYRDGVTEVHTEIPVRPPFPSITEGGGAVVKPGASEKIQLPADWMPGTPRASVTMSSLPEIGVTEAMDFLVHYPYGCLEQTTSSGWALLSLPDLVSAVDPNLATRSQLADALAKRIAIIQSLQSYNGSFSMWPGSGESRWPSIFATHFLVTCDRRGVPVPEGTLSRAIGNLRQLISAVPEADTDTLYGSSLGQMAYASYVISLTDAPPLAWMSYLNDNIASIPPYGRYFLAAAFSRAGEKGAARSILGDSLPAMSLENKPGAEKPNFDSDRRNMALCLLAWNELDPSSPNAVNAVSSLLDSIKGDKYLTTQELGFALPALADFYAHNYSSGTAVLELFGQGRDPLATASQDRAASAKIDEGTKELTVKNSGTGNGYVFWVANGVPLKGAPEQDQGMRVRVQYLSSDGTPLADAPVIRQGERIRGRITVTPLSGEVRNIAITLPLAGGLEIENPRLMDPVEPSEYSQRGDSYGVHHEIRDDRLLLFLESVTKGYTWDFSMRAVTVGEFALPPIYAEAMYSPGIKSTGPTSSITVKN